ncbi:MAG TPA: hypothetical protein VK730_12400 [Solirubrobacteraceae bacterium]|nr:hypothetical protein [Solirubrobacteraceae bacterium]
MAAGEEVAGEASAPAGEATSGVDVVALTDEEAGDEDGSVLAPGSEDGSVPAAEVESGAPAEAEVSPEGGAAAAPASGACASVAIAGAATVVPVVSVTPAAASNPSVGVVGVCASGARVPDTDAGDATIPPSAALAPLVPAALSRARATREGCGVLPAAPLGLFLGWPSAVAVRAQCVASALWNGAPGGAPGGAPSEAPGGAPEDGLDRLAPLEGEPEGSEAGGTPSAIGLFMPGPRLRSK